MQAAVHFVLGHFRVPLTTRIQPTGGCQPCVSLSRNKSDGNQKAEIPCQGDEPRNVVRVRQRCKTQVSPQVYCRFFCSYAMRFITQTGIANPWILVLKVSQPSSTIPQGTPRRKRIPLPM